jgi:hypothetical protein
MQKINGEIELLDLDVLDQDYEDGELFELDSLAERDGLNGADW